MQHVELPFFDAYVKVILLRDVELQCKGSMPLCQCIMQLQCSLQFSAHLFLKPGLFNIFC